MAVDHIVWPWFYHYRTADAYDNDIRLLVTQDQYSGAEWFQ